MPNRSKRRLHPFFLSASVLCFALFPFPLSSQSAHPVFRHYTTDQGLPSPETYDLLQDRRGYLWVSTDNGVSRFDGYEFRNFGPKEGLKNNVVFQLYEDFRGRIWMVTMSENLYYYEYERDSIFPYRYNQTILDQDIYNLGGPGFAVDSAGVIYRSLYQTGILRIDTAGRSRLLTSPAAGGFEVIDFGFTSLVMFDPNLTPGRRERYSERREFPCEFSADGGRTFRTVWVPVVVSQSGGQYGGELRDGRLLLFMESYVYLFDGDRLLWAKQLDFEPSCLFQSRSGAVYLGARSGGGVYQYASLKALENNTYTRYLSGYTIANIYEDRSGGVWLTTIEKGVFYTPNPHWRIYDSEAGFPEDHITALAPHPDGGWYVGGKRGSVVYWRPDGKAVTVLPRSEQDKEIFDLYFDPVARRFWKGSLWLYFREEAGDWQTTYAQVGTEFQRISAGNKNFKVQGRRLWTASFNGFGRIDLDGAVVDYNSRPLGLRQRVFVAFEDKSGRVWVGDVRGLFELRDDRLQAAAPTHPAFSLRVEDIDQLPDSTLVIGTKGGGVILWKGDRIRQIGAGEGLTADMVEQVYVDAQANIWVGTLNGLNRITRVSPDSFSVSTFTMADGLPSNEINDIEVRDREAWIATTRGLIPIPADENRDHERPRPFFETITVNDRPLDPSLPHRLTAGQNNLHFSFLAINYALNGDIRYQYRLHPLETWQTTRSRTLNYAKIPPGRYTFELRAANPAGQWSETTALAFTIAKPLWKRWWFYLLGALTALLLGYGYYRRRIKQLKREADYQRVVANFEKEKATRERERSRMEKEMVDLKQSALRAQINPHFIFNTLNSIQDFIAAGDPDRATRHLARFARLIRSALHASLQNEVTLQEEVDLLQHYLALEQMRFPGKFEYTIEVAPDIDTFDTRVPPMLIQPYVENAILHGLVDTQNNGLVQIKYTQENGRLLVEISDNGIGIETSRRRSGMNNLRKSVGMTITEKRLELLDRNDTTEKVQVRELKTPDGASRGTAVLVKIALK